jgi:hypothetical protein
MEYVARLDITIVAGNHLCVRWKTDYRTGKGTEMDGNGDPYVHLPRFSRFWWLILTQATLTVFLTYPD